MKKDLVNPHSISVTRSVRNCRFKHKGFYFNYKTMNSLVLVLQIVTILRKWSEDRYKINPVDRVIESIGKKTTSYVRS